ncbi:cAMP-dependent protein kinase [Skeletonema marinoi]|uniref:cAMP-dependent protein kinase n=4 Tax=Skeletonema marinoi TaxID=267567 RepID=A0AAD8Y394_9STRA|nr:cAMP-dependent protein kinase [Skeletonema marinoi]
MGCSSSKPTSVAEDDAPTAAVPAPSSALPVVEDTAAAALPSSTNSTIPSSFGNKKPPVSKERKVSFENSPAVNNRRGAQDTAAQGGSDTKQGGDNDDPFASHVHSSKHQQPKSSTNKNNQSIMEDSWAFLHRITKDKLLDASDVKSVESGKLEITSIRRYAQQLLVHLQEVELGQSAALGSSVLGGVTEPDEEEKEEVEGKAYRDGDRRALYDKQDFLSFKKEKSWKSEETQKLIRDIIQKKTLFEHYSEDEILEIVDVFKPVTFKKGECIIRQGDSYGDNFYVVETGQLNVHTNVAGNDGEDNQVLLRTCSKGDHFGEPGGLVGGQRSKRSISALTDCKCWSLARETFSCVISQLRHNQHEEKMKFFRACEIQGRSFNHIFDGIQIEGLAIAAKTDVFDEGSVIIRGGEPSDVFYFLRSGEVNAYEKGLYSSYDDDSLNKLAFAVKEKRAFGTTSILKRSNSPYTYVAKTPVRVYYITKDSFELMLGSLRDALDGNTVSQRSVARSKSSKSYRDRDVATMIADRVHSHLELKDLKFYKMLGKGAFGKVFLVQSTQDKALFALKCQVKNAIVKHRNQEKVLNECRILKTVGHDPNILGLHNVMQDKRHLYFLIDLLPGNELWFYKKKFKRFPESMARFYAASVLLAFERLHTDLIAYRDLKPENIVLDGEGYGVLVDFGLAKQIEEGQTFTGCGTPDYMAPEVILRIGHDWAVDYWTLGIFLYELVHDRAPFYDTDRIRRQKKILRGVDYVTFPTGFSEPLQDLIRHLLVGDQSKRLGRTQSGIQGIKSHRFFAGFDWEGLEARRIAPAIKPAIPQDLKTIGKGAVGASPVNDISVPTSNWNPNLKTFEGWLKDNNL